MARPQKATVKYFPHDTIHGSTMMVLESRWNDKGYVFWFKLLESLGSHENHYIDCRKPAEWEFLLAKTRCDNVTATEILDTLSRLEAIDGLLWGKYKVIACENFLNRISDAYGKRISAGPTLQNVYSILNISFKEFPVEETPQNDDEGTGNPQIKVNEIKENKSSSSGEIATGENLPDLEPKPTKMTIFEFRKLYSDSFNQLMPGGLNEQASILCREYTTEIIQQAFEAACIYNKKNLAYVKAILFDKSRASPTSSDGFDWDAVDAMRKETGDNGTGRIDAGNC